MAPTLMKRNSVETLLEKSTLARNSILEDDKLLKSLENSVLKSTFDQTTVTQLPKVRMISDSGKFEWKIGGNQPKIDTASKSCALSTTENKFLMTNSGKFLENRLILDTSKSSSLLEESLKKAQAFAAKLEEDLKWRCSKLEASCSRSSMVLPKLVAPSITSTNFKFEDLSQGLKTKNENDFTFDADKVEFRQAEKRKVDETSTSAAIVDEILDLSSGYEGPRPLKRAKISVVDAENVGKVNLSDELEQIRLHKVHFVNCVAGSLICSPNFRSGRDETRNSIITVADKIAIFDPEFVLKVALYSRCDLNIRTTSNFLLAYASTKPSCRKFLRKYYAATIRLPSDWIEVVELYDTLITDSQKKNKHSPLPNALRQVMVDKFGDFDQYQLAKHNKNKKSNKGKKAKKEMEEKRARRGDGARKRRWGVNSDDEDGDEDMECEQKTAPKPKLNLKKMIRQLHIKKPAEYVMSILGKKYPSDRLKFERSGLLGSWNESRSGKRMKLAIPETWETQVALKGNKPEVWQDLLDHKKLPYMALLRNLRNIIKSGVEQKYHKLILQRLENENAVMNSKQFPFRFFSAYHVLDQLVTEYHAKIEFMTKKGRTAAKLPSKAVKKGKVVEWWVLKKQRKNLKMSINYDEILISQYRKALDNAVRIATVHNVKPIHGRTVVLIDLMDTNSPCQSAKGLGKPRTIEEIAVLLALMCSYVCENCKIILFHDEQYTEAVFTKGTILDNMKSVLEQCAKLHEISSTKSQEVMVALNNISVDKLSNVEFDWGSCKARARVAKNMVEVLKTYLFDRTKIDNILLLGANIGEDENDVAVRAFLSQYRRLVNDRTLFVNIDLCGQAADQKHSTDERDVNLRGYSDQILRYVAERGNADQLAHIENIDMAYNLLVNVQNPIPPFRSLYEPNFFQLDTSSRNQLPNVVRVFVSSTFIDMQSERTVLLRYVFPELQRRVRERFSLDICPIDLRWGITENQAHSHSSVNLCLNEVSKCTLFVGLLGERYGYCASDYSKIVDENGRQYDWLKNFPPASSITELEIFQFALQNEKHKERAFFYFRNTDTARNVPEQYSHLMSEKKDVIASDRLNKLKGKIIADGFKVYNGYPWSFDGVRNGLPYLTGLHRFAEQVLDDLWNGLTKIYEKFEFQPGGINGLKTQWQFVANRSANFVGREKIVKAICADIAKSSSDLHLLSSKGAFGKTTMMSSLADKFSKNESLYGSPIICFKDSVVGMKNVDAAGLLFKYLSNCAGNMLETMNDIISPAKWNEMLKSLTDCGYRLTFLIDGFDDSQIDWLFDCKCQNVKFIVSVNENSPLESSLVNRKLKYRKWELAELDINDRSAVVRQVLTAYGKSLDESAFNNQMRILLSKRDSSLPAYLLLACEELRLFGRFDNITSTLRSMSSSFVGLIRDILKQVEADHDQLLIEIILLLIVMFDGELTQLDVYVLTAMALDISKNKKIKGELSYYPALEIFYNSWNVADVLPYSTFMFVYNSLSAAFFDEVQVNDETVLVLKFHEVGSVVRKFYVKNQRLVKTLNVLYAVFLMKSCNPQNDNKFSGVVARHFSLLPNSLLATTSLHFIERCFSLRAFVNFKHFYDLLLTNIEKNSFIDSVTLQDFQRFITEKSETLYKSTYPVLMPQEINNQPSCSVLSEISEYSNSIWEDASSNAVKFLDWINKPHEYSSCYRSTRIEKSACIVVSSENRLVAVGCNDGRVLLFEFESGTLITTFIGHCDAVTDVCFLNDRGDILASCSNGGSIIVWNTKLLIKIASLDGHSNYVSMCRTFKWGKVASLISVSWDCSVRLWNYLQSKQVDIIKEKVASPINCVDCHPSEPKIVFGQWNNNLIVYSVSPLERKAVLRGHKSSVRAVAYHPNGLFIISASMDGEVKLWSSLFAAQLGSFSGHSEPVTKLMFSHESLITSAEDSLIKVWSPLLGVPLNCVEAENEQISATASSLSSDGKKFVVGYNTNAVKFFEVNGVSQKEVWCKQMGSVVRRLKFFPRKQLIFAVCNKSAHILSIANKNIVTTFDTSSETIDGGDCCEAFAALIFSNGGIAFYSLEVIILRQDMSQLLKPYKVVHGHTGAVLDCSFNANGELLATVGVDRNLFLWDTAAATSPDDTSVYNCHDDIVTCCTWSDLKDILITGSNDCSLKVWSTKTMQLLTTFTAHRAPIVCVSVKRGCIVSASTDGVICVWSSKGILVTQLQDESHSTPSCVDILLKAKDYTESWAEIIFDEEEEAEEMKDEKAIRGFDAVNFDEALLLASFANGKTRIWKPFLGHSKCTLSSHNASICGLGVSSAVDSSRFVSLDAEGLCKFWMPKSLETEGQNIHSGAVVCADVNKFLKECIATGGRDCKVVISGKKYNRIISFAFVAHSKSVSGVLWRASNALVTAGEDGCVKFWTIDCENCFATFNLEIKFDSPISVLASKGDSMIVVFWSGVAREVFNDGKTSASFEALSASLRGNWISSLKFCRENFDVSVATDNIKKPVNAIIKPDITPLNYWINTSSSFSVPFECIECRLSIVGNDLGRIQVLNKKESTLLAGWQAHSSRVTGIAVLIKEKSRLDETVFCTVSLDRALKIWKGLGALIGFWESPAALNFVEFDAESKLLWCGDVLGCIYCLKVVCD